MQINITYDTHRDNPNVLAKLAGALGAEVLSPMEYYNYVAEPYACAESGNTEAAGKAGKTATEIAESQPEEPAKPEGEPEEDLSPVRGKNAENLRDELLKIVTSGEDYDTAWWERQHARLPKKHQDAIREATLEPRTDNLAAEKKEEDTSPPQELDEFGDPVTGGELPEEKVTLGDLRALTEALLNSRPDADQLVVAKRIREMLSELFGARRVPEVKEEDYSACYAKLKEIEADLNAPETAEEDDF